MITVYIDGNPVQVKEGSIVLDACDKAGAYVPRLCYHPDLPVAAKCGLCLIRLNDEEIGSFACATDVEDGMKIDTKNESIKMEVTKIYQSLNDKYNLQINPQIDALVKHFSGKGKYLDSKPHLISSIQFTPVECVGCLRCFRACNEIQKTYAMKGGPWAIDSTMCISCGQCTSVCPSKGITEISSIPDVLRALASGKILVLQTAPSARVSVGELFGDAIGTVCTGKVISAARQLGFKYVFDTNMGADFTIIEEASELIERITKNERLPMFTSCCPAWIKYVQTRHPELLPHLSTAKSPALMLGSLLKSYWAEKNKLNKKSIFSVSLMPCVAKKEERKWTDDVDAVLTVREFGTLIETFGIQWNELPEGQFDPVLGESSSSATIFGVTGGVMEAALRYAQEELSDESLGTVSYSVVRGFDRIRSADVKVGDLQIKVAICSGIGAAKEFIEGGKYKEFTFIEVMSCPGGCIGGGGQPKVLHGLLDVQKRAETIYKIANEIDKPTSRNNLHAMLIYKTFIGDPNKEKAHQYLHIPWV